MTHENKLFSENLHAMNQELFYLLKSIILMAISLIDNTNKYIEL